jgi:NAD(P)-dependent dehydrogenase (short-subunit alcohol dehydrogenase family)
MKTVLITGAGGNLGAAAVDRFVDNGYHVVALVSPGKIPTEQRKHVDYMEADLLQEGPVQELIDRAFALYAAIDGVVLTVGGFEAGDVEATDEAAMKRMYSLNFETAYHVARPSFRCMQSQPGGGHIIFIGAKPALDAKAGKSLMAYGLSKSLLFKLAEYLNAASEKVKSHVIVFSTLDTPQNRTSMPKADTSQWVRPEKVASVMVEIVNGETLGDVVEIGP